MEDNNKGTDMNIEIAQTPPSSFYTSESIFEKSKSIFENSYQFVCHQSELEKSTSIPFNLLSKKSSKPSIPFPSGSTCPIIFPTEVA